MKKYCVVRDPPFYRIHPGERATRQRDQPTIESGRVRRAAVFKTAWILDILFFMLLGASRLKFWP